MQQNIKNCMLSHIGLHARTVTHNM